MAKKNIGELNAKVTIETAQAAQDVKALAGAWDTYKAAQQSALKSGATNVNAGALAAAERERQMLRQITGAGPTDGYDKSRLEAFTKQIGVSMRDAQGAHQFSVEAMAAQNERLTSEFSRVSKSARDSAAVFEAVAAEEIRINDLRAQQAAQSNQRITAEQYLVSKSAKESASVFEAVAAEEARINDLRVQQAVQSNQRITASLQGTAKSARDSAAVFEALAAEEMRINDLRAQQAAQSNQRITASLQGTAKSARDSAAVFEAMFEAQEQSDQQFTTQFVNNSAKRRKSIFDEASAIDAASSTYGTARSRIASLNQGQLAGSKAASRFGLVMQQSGYQVQDFAVQVASGQNALVAFSQQGSQLLSVFAGPWGAVAAAGLSVGVLAYQIYNATKSAKDGKVQIDGLAESVKRFNEAVSEANYNETNIRAKPAFIEKEIARAKEERRLLQAKAGYESTPEGREKNLQEQEDIRKRILDLTLKQKNALRDVAKLDADLAAAQRKTAAEFEKRINQAIKLSLTEGRASLAIYGTETQKLAAEIEDINFLLQSSDSGDRIQAYQMIYALKQERDAILDKIDPTRIQIRQQERLLALVKNRIISEKEANNYLKAQYNEAVMNAQSRLPQQLNVTTGANALGGMAGNGASGQVIDIQKGILDAVRQLVTLARLDSGGSGVN